MLSSHVGLQIQQRVKYHKFLCSTAGMSARIMFFRKMAFKGLKIHKVLVLDPLALAHKAKLVLGR